MAFASYRITNDIGSVRGIDAKFAQRNTAPRLEQTSRPALAALRAWLTMPTEKPGVATPTGAEIAALIIVERRMIAINVSAPRKTTDGHAASVSVPPCSPLSPAS
jgi:hypothetical protein